jgi:hypothetical protein
MLAATALPEFVIMARFRADEAIRVMSNLIPEDPHILANNILAPIPKIKRKARK